MWEGENELWKQSTENVDDNRMWVRQMTQKIYEKNADPHLRFLYALDYQNEVGRVYTLD